MTTLRDFFTSKLGESHDPRFNFLQGTVLFDFEKAGSWLLTIDRGHLKLEENHLLSGKSDECWIRWNEAEFLDMMYHQLDFLTAFQQGRIQIGGNRAIATAAAIFLRNNS